MNNKIAKNTLLLYLRMFFTLVVGLYTSRVVLNSLGFSDYGIYNVVGGIVTMLTFFNAGMASASQIFISYSLGKGDLKELKNVFCTSVITHISIALLVAIILESIGIWFLNCKMNIPLDRMFAANCVFQLSILTLIVSIISVPYNSCIIAHEKMGTFAYISIFETMSKLFIAYVITFSYWDKLVLYASLLAILQIIIRFIYTFYCKNKFKECSFAYKFDRKLFREMFAFAGWGSIGNMGFSLKDQGSNIILNLFFGTTINAARGIATQVNGIVNQFASNFTMAMNPQITKSYAAGDIQESIKLANEGSKFAFFLLSCISIPLILNIDYILKLWLGKVPNYTSEFVVIIVLCSVIYSLTHTLSTSILSTGKVKWFQSFLAIILLAELPISYMILFWGGKPYYALIPALFTNFASLILRLIILHKLIPQYNIMEYVSHILIRCLVVFCFSLGISYVLLKQLPDGILYVVLSFVGSFVIVVASIYTLGLTKVEKNKLLSVVKNKIVKKNGKC